MRSPITPKARVTITFNRDFREYRVPGPKGTEAQAYYTDDKHDAVGTAHLIYGPDVKLAFKSLN